MSQRDWAEHRSKKTTTTTTTSSSSSSRGKKLFQQCQERQEESVILPGVDLEEIEDEFEKLHEQMMREGDSE